MLVCYNLKTTWKIVSVEELSKAGRPAGTLMRTMLNITWCKKTKSINGWHFVCWILGPVRKMTESQAGASKHHSFSLFLSAAMMWLDPWILPWLPSNNELHSRIGRENKPMLTYVALGKVSYRSISNKTKQDSISSRWETTQLNNKHGPRHFEIKR